MATYFKLVLVASIVDLRLLTRLYRIKTIISIIFSDVFPPRSLSHFLDISFAGKSRERGGEEKVTSTESRGLAVKENKKSREQAREMAFLISSRKINSVPQNESRVCIGHTCTYTHHCVFIYKCPEQLAATNVVEETRIRFDSWLARPGIFLIHQRRVTYCDAGNNWKST